MNDLVIQFYELIRMMVKYPDSKRLINWRLRFFDKRVSEILVWNDPMLYKDVSQMVQELALCKQRRRSRRWYYDLSSIDEISVAYDISHSPSALSRAWDLFHSGHYKIQ